MQNWGLKQKKPGVFHVKHAGRAQERWKEVGESGEGDFGPFQKGSAVEECGDKWKTLCVSRETQVTPSAWECGW